MHCILIESGVESLGIPCSMWIVCFVSSLSSETVLSCETATPSDIHPPNAVTLRRSSRVRAVRGRPQSLIDYKSYMDTKRRVAWILEQSSCSMSPDIHDLVENIKSVLKSDEKHMAEAVSSATFLEQVVLLLVFIRWCGNPLPLVWKYRFTDQTDFLQHFSFT